LLFGQIKKNREKGDGEENNLKNQKKEEIFGLKNDGNNCYINV
jgi:ubiquitin C-terminal hydrolase